MDQISLHTLHKLNHQSPTASFLSGDSLALFVESDSVGWLGSKLLSNPCMTMLKSASQQTGEQLNNRDSQTQFIRTVIHRKRRAATDNHERQAIGAVMQNQVMPPNQYMPPPTPAIVAKAQELGRLGISMDQTAWRDCYTKALVEAMNDVAFMTLDDPDNMVTKFSDLVATKFEEVALATLQFFIDNSAKIKLAQSGLQLPGMS